jgi:hypothetical protein
MLKRTDKVTVAAFFGQVLAVWGLGAGHVQADLIVNTLGTPVVVDFESFLANAWGRATRFGHLAYHGPE